MSQHGDTAENSQGSHRVGPLPSLGPTWPGACFCWHGKHGLSHLLSLFDKQESIHTSLSTHTHTSPHARRRRHMYMWMTYGQAEASTLRMYVRSEACMCVSIYTTRGTRSARLPSHPYLAICSCSCIGECHVLVWKMCLLQVQFSPAWRTPVPLGS